MKNSEHKEKEMKLEQRKGIARMGKEKVSTAHKKGKK
jgi:hypothetical protein